MNAGTHTIGGLAAGAACFTFFPMPFSLGSIAGVVFTASTIAGSLLPDICQPSSWIGRRLGIFSKMINKMFGHRTFTHSVIFILLVYLLAGALQGSAGTAVQYGVTSGAVSHVLLDMLTPRGVAIMYPIKYYIKAPVTAKTGSIFGEGIIAFLLMGWIVYFSMTIIG